MAKSSKDTVEAAKLSPWKKLDAEEIFSSQWLTLRRESCQLPSGSVIDDYFTLELPNGITIVAVTADNQLVLVRQYKHGLGRVVLELPAGNVSPGEALDSAAKRELIEETGFSATQVEYITTLAAKPARMKALTAVYFTRNVVQKIIPDNNEMERIIITLVPVTELPSLIKRREIITETSLAAILSVWDKLGC